MSKVDGVTCHEDLFITYGGDGVRVFNTDPLCQLLHLAPEALGAKYASSVRVADILRRTNLIAYNLRSQELLVKVWDTDKVVREIEFHQPVINLRFHHDNTLLVVLQGEIYVFRVVPQVVKLSVFETRENFSGVMALNNGTLNSLLAFPAKFKNGHVEIVDLKDRGAASSRAPVTFQAHEHSIARLAFNPEATRLATASVYGTIVRLFDVAKRNLLMEFRRGSDSALVYSLTFSTDSSYLSATSDKGTVHIFSVVDKHMNRKSLLSSLSALTKDAYLTSQWSPVQIKVPAELACVCSFLREHRQTLVAVCVDGSFRKYTFKPDGSISQVAFDKYLDLGNMMEM